jgi:hypothetical protein
VKPTLFILFGVTTLVTVVVQIGARLPREHRVSRTATLPQPPAEVWAAIAQAASSASVPVDVLESKPPSRLVTRVKQSEKQFGGTWTIDIAPDGSGSAVTITEDGWVASPIFRFMSRYVIGHNATMDALLKKVTKEIGSTRD